MTLNEVLELARDRINCVDSSDPIAKWLIDVLGDESWLVETRRHYLDDARLGIDIEFDSSEPINVDDARCYAAGILRAADHAEATNANHKGRWIGP